MMVAETGAVAAVVAVAVAAAVAGPGQTSELLKPTPQTTPPTPGLGHCPPPSLFMPVQT